MSLCLRVGQQDVDIKLSGHFIKEIHCVFVSETNDQGEGKTPVCLCARSCSAIRAGGPRDASSWAAVSSVWDGGMEPTGSTNRNALPVRQSSRTLKRRVGPGVCSERPQVVRSLSFVPANGVSK